MKTIIIVALIAGSVALSSCGPGQYVQTRPEAVGYNRPISPGADYLWINGDWYWSGGRYQWHEGRWDRPRVGRTWHEGNWSQSRRGYRWNRGRWR